MSRRFANFVDAGSYVPGYQVPGALWLDGAADFLSRTPASAGDQKKWTFSCWVKRLRIDADERLLEAGPDANTRGFIAFNSSNQLQYFCNNSSIILGQVTTNAVFRDTTAFMHVAVELDTANNSVKFFVNGIEQAQTVSTVINNTDHLINGATIHAIGRSSYSSSQFLKSIIVQKSMMSGVNNALTAYAEFDTQGVWRPIEISGHATNNVDYLLDFANSADLGNDVSGNVNDWALTSITSANASADVPSDLLPSVNLLDEDHVGTVSTGGTVVTGTTHALLNISIPSGKYAWKLTADATAAYGIEDDNEAHTTYAATSADVLEFELDIDAGTLKVRVNGGAATSVATGLATQNYRPYMAGAFTLMQVFTPADSTFKMLKLADLPEPTVKNVDDGFVQVIDTEANIEATLTAAITAAGWGAVATIRTYKNRTAVERWMLVYSDDAANELDCQATLVAKATKRALAGSDNWVGYAERVGAAHGLYTAEIAHTTGTDTTTAHGLSSDTSRFEADMRSIGTGDWWESHPYLTANYNIKRNSGIAETVTQYISVGATNVVVKGAAPTATYRVIVRAEIPGFREFGKYTGNGSTDGSFHNRSVRPVFTQLKRTDATNDWGNWDEIRDIDNPVRQELVLNSTAAETSASGDRFDILSNGIKLRNIGVAFNASGGTYISEIYGSPTGGINTTPAPTR